MNRVTPQDPPPPPPPQSPDPAATANLPPLAARVLYMLVFAVVFWIITWTLAVTALVQLLVTVLTTRPQPELTRFGRGLANYARQIIEFLTFASEVLPFPFSEWPAA
jgi:hypothetical protein